MMVDEADIDLIGGSSSSGGISSGRGMKRMLESSGPRPPKRKPGPLPKDLKIRRPFTPPSTPPSSPAPPIIAPIPVKIEPKVEITSEGK